MKITVCFSQVEGPAVAALTANLADILAAISLQGTPVELSLQCATEEEELPTELVQSADYWKVQQVTLDDVIARALNYPPTVGDKKNPDKWGPENL